MLAAAFAALSAVGYGAGQFATQLGLRRRRVRALQALLINLTAANAVLAVSLAIVWAVSPMNLDWLAVAYFAAAGLAGPFAGRTLNFLAIQRVGATRTASLGMSESLFAAALGWTILDQRLTALTAVGMVVLLAGMILFINETGRTLRRPVPDTTDVAALELERRAAAERPTGQVAAGVAIGLASGLFFSMAGVMRELGLEILPSAVLGAAVGSFVALAITVLNVARTGQLRGVFRVPGADALPLAASGVLASAGMVCFFLALQLGGGLAVSTTLKNLTPLVTFALSALFIAHLERVTVRLGLLVGVIVMGAIIMTAGR